LEKNVSQQTSGCPRFKSGSGDHLLVISKVRALLFE
jgi:hypothetical protein